jgi:replicative DNA helicase
MSDYEYAIVQEYYKTLDEWEKDDLLIPFEGSKNPSGISMYLEQFARKHGTIIDKDKNDKSMENILAGRKYIPNHPNHIVLVIVDHIGILAPEKDLDKSKGQIDKFSKVMREARDTYGFSPVIVQQLNRSLSDVTRLKLGDLAPKLSDFADSSQTQHDADVVLALFEPYRHISGDLDGHKENGYSLKGFRDEYFKTYYRSLHILKNSFGTNGIQFPMALQPELGIFKTLPQKKDIKDGIYEQVTSSNYFTTE